MTGLTVGFTPNMLPGIFFGLISLRVSGCGNRCDRPFRFPMRADCFLEPQRIPGDLCVEMQAAFMSVLEVVQMPLNRKLNVAARDDLTAQNGVVVGAVGMVSDMQVM